MQEAETLENLLDRLENLENETIAQQEAEAFLRRHGTAGLVELEQAAAARGMPHERMRQLCSSHRQVCAGEGSALRAKLPEGHMIATLMDEHQRILAKLTRLSELSEPEHRTANEPADRAVLEEMSELGVALIGAEPHHAREEQVLFPALRKLGISGPPNVMEAEHVEIRSMKHDVKHLADAALRGDTEAWARLRRTARALAQMLTEHIEKEDGILYPLAVERITDTRAWAEMKLHCDRIGYCCHGHDSGTNCESST